MERSQELFEKIENYLNNRLADKEKEQFERQLEKDDALRKEVALHQQLQANWKDKDAIAFRKKISQVPLKPQKKDRNWTALSLKIAAVFALLFATAFFLLRSDETSDEELFKEYYVLYPAEDILRGQPSENKKQQILTVYSNQDFAAAVDDLEQLQTEFPEDDSFPIYLGNCYLNLGEINKAISIFDEVPTSSKLYDHAQWYLALGYLKNKNIRMAEEVLDRIIGSKSIHQENALELLNKLENHNPDDQ